MPTSERRMRTIVAFQSHLITPGIVREFRKLQKSFPDHYTLVFLMHLPPGSLPPKELLELPHHFVTTDDIRAPDYPVKSGGGEEWSIWEGGHTDLPFLHLYRTFPDYDRYWFMEYDVRFSGHWWKFFRAFEGNDTDFLSTTIRTSSAQPSWWRWSQFAVPSSFAGGVSSDFPPGRQAPSLLSPDGASDVIPDFPHDRLVACLMCFFRASRAAMEVMDRAYREGWGGHCEVTWPTLLHNVGLRVEDIGGEGEFVAPGNHRRFYENTAGDGDLSPGTFVFRPSKLPVPRWRRDTLWHPVKPWDIALRERYHYGIGWYRRRRHRVGSLLRRWMGA